jgi:gluconolactonase
MREQVYRYNFNTGAITVVADGFAHPNGITMTPDGKKAYITDTGIGGGFFGFNLTAPASVYSFDVTKDGTFVNRQTFAFTPSLIPDGMYCILTNKRYIFAC